MASKWPPVRGAAYDFPVAFFAQSDNQIKKTVTLATGDVKISKDYGAFANLTTLPDEDPDGSGQVKVSLSSDEMTADVITIQFIDAAGAEWNSFSVTLFPTAQTQDAIGSNVTAILVDTGTTLDALIQDLPTNAELATALGTADDAVIAAIAALNNLSSAELTAAIAAGDDAVLAAIAALHNLAAAEINAELVDVLRIDTLPDSYAADGVQPTIAQAVLEIRQFLMERVVFGAALNVKKPDGVTTAFTLTLDDATNPTAITRA
jgi:molybdopterin converting factor small subunit